MDIKELFKPKVSKRDQYIEEHGVDPRTINRHYPDSGIRLRHCELGEEIHERGGTKSRRRTTLVWAPVE